MSNWPPPGIHPSGLPSYCDIRNPQASKAACMTGGGTEYTNNLCNIINPNTNVDKCNASIQTSQAAQNWASEHIGIVVVLGIIGILIFILILRVWFSISSMSGGSRKFNSIFKRFFR